MNIERMERMAEILRAVCQERRRFSLAVWVDYVKLWGKGEPECGTACCAVGWAAQDPWMNAEGLRLRALRQSAHGGTIEKRILPDGPVPSERFEPSNPGEVELIEPVYLGSTGFDAVARFFDIPKATADYLFLQDSYEDGDDTKPEDVLSRVEHAIALAKARGD